MIHLKPPETGKNGFRRLFLCAWLRTFLPHDAHLGQPSRQHPIARRIEFEEARRIGKAYEEIEKIQPYLGNRRVHADICILQSDISDTLKVTKPIPIRSVSRTKISGKHREALLGAMKLCDTEWVNWGSPLPGEGTGYPAIAEHAVGEGRVLSFCFDFFSLQ